MPGGAALAYPGEHRFEMISDSAFGDDEPGPAALVGQSREFPRGLLPEIEF